MVTLAMTFGCERKVINEMSDELVADATACFACHSDQNFDLVAAQEQWRGSKHASGDNIDRNRINGYGFCEKCHTNEGFLIEVVGESVDTLNFTAIGCFTCHQPHTQGSLELRTAAVVSLANTMDYDKGGSNICANCHQSRRNAGSYIFDGVTIDNRWGPHHSCQSDMLLGTNAYEYEDYGYDNSAHTNATIDGCLDCHMSPSGDYMLGGHSFGMEVEQKELYNLSGCNSLNCHNNELEDFDYRDVRHEVAELLDSLKALLLNADLLEEVEEDGVIEYLPVDDREVTTADSAGAVYNYLFVHEDQSHGVHNADYAIGLLESSINYLVHGNPEGQAFAGGGQR